MSKPYTQGVYKMTLFMPPTDHEVVRGLAVRVTDVLNTCNADNLVDTACHFSYRYIRTAHSVVFEDTVRSDYLRKGTYSAMYVNTSFAVARCLYLLLDTSPSHALSSLLEPYWPEHISRRTMLGRAIPPQLVGMFSGINMRGGVVSLREIK